LNEYSFNIPTLADLKTAAEKSDKRARLLDAALALFEARGVDGVAVPEIAKAAGVAIGTIYRYFETKDALVNALYRQWKSAYNQIVLAPAPAHFGPRQAFSFRWQRIMLFARANPAAMRFLTLHHHAPHLDVESRALDEADYVATEAFLAGMPEAPAISAYLIPALIWGAAAGLLKFSSEGQFAFDASAAAETEDALWRAIGPPRRQKSP
jgi:AcrR family transcriptional regulator